MTKAEIATLLGIMKAAYPKFYGADFNIVTTVDVWHGVLLDIELDEAKKAAQMHISTNIYPPTIADIRMLVAEIRGYKPPDASKAWEQVKGAISKFGSYRESEAIESMSEDVKQVVKAMGFKEICMSENHMADRAHFIKLYESYSINKNKQSALPDHLQSASLMQNRNIGKLIADTAKNTSIE